MAYATYTDVNVRTAPYFTADANSTPTRDTVTSWIAEHDARVNGALRTAGYTVVPATGADDLLFLRGIVADAVALKTLFVALGAGNVPATLIDALGSPSFAQTLDMIREGHLLLPDQTASQSTFALGYLALNTDDQLTY